MGQSKCGLTPVPDIAAEEGVEFYFAPEPPPPFPTTVRIGYRDYSIERWDPRLARANRSMGETCLLTAKIRIDAQLLEFDPVEAANTLLHEIMHAAWLDGGLEDEDKQERTITVLANQLTGIWRDNPALVAWLDHNIGGGK